MVLAPPQRFCPARLSVRVVEEPVQFKSRPLFRVAAIVGAPATGSLSTGYRHEPCSSSVSAFEHAESSSKTQLRDEKRAETQAQMRVVADHAGVPRSTV
jgi:hypothetical protein